MPLGEVEVNVYKNLRTRQDLKNPQMCVSSINEEILDRVVSHTSKTANAYIAGHGISFEYLTVLVVGI
jgi:hypothetical protein